MPAARSRLDLHVHVPSTILDGLGQYTHCWVIYVFHLNTGMRPSTCSDYLAMLSCVLLIVGVMQICTRQRAARASKEKLSRHG